MKKVKGALSILLTAFLTVAGTSSSATTFNSVTHIHDVKVFGTSILLPSHEGLYKYQAANSMKIMPGPVFDVMGLAVLGNTLFASGHPGVNSIFPDPVGLITSQDGGKSWKAVSLQGKADFHMLEVSKFDIYGADAVTGLLMHSANQGRSWKKLGSNKYSDIAAHPTKKGVAYGLAQGSLVRTTNSFASAVTVKSKIKWQSVEFINDRIFAASGKSVYQSSDEGKTWKKLATLPGEISNISINGQVFSAVANNVIHVSRDGGKSFKS